MEAQEIVSLLERVRFPSVTPGPVAPTEEQHHGMVKVPGSNPGRSTQQHNMGM